MILQALVKRYEGTSKVPPGWQKRKVSYVLEIDADGTLLDIAPLGDDSAGLTLTLPSIGSGRSGKKAYETAYFLGDDGKYMLGIGKDGAKKFQSAQLLHKKLLSSVDEPAARAIVAYFDAGPPTVPESFDPKDKETAKYVFSVNGRRIDYGDGGEKIRSAWKSSEQQTAESGDQGLCLVTGKYDTIARLHDKVELRGVTMSKQPLISMNDQTSFRSYGTEPKDPPAMIGATAAFAYTAALNELLNSEKHRQFMGGDTLVYWAEGEDETEVKTFSLTISPKESDDVQLGNIMATIAKGKLPDIEGVTWDKPFYLLDLSPNAARISIRFFYTSSFGDIIKRIANHYENLEISSSEYEKFKHISYWDILSATTVKENALDARPLLGVQLMQSIITGAQYPATLFNTIMARVRAGGDIDRTKAAVIKAVLNRKSNEESEVITVSLNESSDNKPYVLGRLFSVLEQLQRSAHYPTKLNRTIRDSYFTSACTNPGSVFPTLLRLSMHHAAKIGYPERYEKPKKDLLDKLDEVTSFPTVLSLDDQGRFILGYYHQTQNFIASITVQDQESKEDESDV
jgi:CRISPR-associated protein Csd1